MNLRSLDLNLLLVFDAVYQEQSISKAAVRLALSQPTVSNALARLRERLGDPLFERTAHGMAPTPRAKTLAEPIRQALLVLERGLRGHEDFDFANSQREFVVAVEDYGETVVLPRFVDWLASVAPGIRIRIRPEPSGQLRGELREGTVDLALDYFALTEPGFHSKCVLTETLLTLSRRGHPEIGERLTLEDYLALRHVVLTPRASTMPMIDLALSKRGLQRRIAVTVPHFLSMPVMVQSSTMLCTLPRRMALLYADFFRLQSHAVPLRIPQFPVYLLWHESAGGDAGHQWFRTHLMEFCERL
ncbi:MAG: LysR family transcriptional regulator [Burkholderiaceae bacterium]|nr:MAG: LysR family transcriptional regulator [Burkholderiaceae bacterium]